MAALEALRHPKSRTPSIKASRQSGLLVEFSSFTFSMRCPRTLIGRRLRSSAGAGRRLAIRASWARSGGLSLWSPEWISRNLLPVLRDRQRLARWFQWLRDGPRERAAGRIEIA